MLKMGDALWGSKWGRVDAKNGRRGAQNGVALLLKMGDAELKMGSRANCEAHGYGVERRRRADEERVVRQGAARSIRLGLRSARTLAGGRCRGGGLGGRVSLWGWEGGGGRIRVGRGR